MRRRKGVTRVWKGRLVTWKWIGVMWRRRTSVMISGIGALKKHVGCTRRASRRQFRRNGWTLIWVTSPLQERDMTVFKRWTSHGRARALGQAVRWKSIAAAALGSLRQRVRCHQGREQSRRTDQDGGKTSYRYTCGGCSMHDACNYRTTNGSTECHLQLALTGTAPMVYRRQDIMEGVSQIDSRKHWFGTSEEDM